MFEEGEIVCFRESHRWVGCIGFVNEVKRNYDGEVERLMIGVPAPLQGVAYVYATPCEVEKMYGKLYPYEVR